MNCRKHKSRKNLHQVRIISLLLIAISSGGNAFAQNIISDPLNTEKSVSKKVISISCGAINLNINSDDELSLAIAIDFALCNNPETKSSWLTAKAASARVGVERSKYLPTIEASADATRNFADRSTNTTTPNIYNSYGAGVSLGYLIYDFGAREANIDYAKQQMIEYAFNYNSLIQNTVFKVVKYYLDIFTATETLEAAKINVNSSAEALEVAKAKFKVGSVTKADTAQSETAYSQAVLESEKALNSLKLAKGAFATLLHLPVDFEPKLATINPDEIGTDLNDDVTKYIEQAIAERPDLAAKAAKQKQLEANLKKANAGDYPTISASANATNDKYSKGINANDNAGDIKLSLTIPLFNGFENTYKKLEAKNALEAAKLDKLKAEDDVKLDIWNSYHNHKTSLQTYKTAQNLLESAKAFEEIALGRYKVGKGTLSDALEAQAKLADARKQLVAARYNTIITRFDLFRALGNTDWSKQFEPKKPEEKPTSTEAAPVSEPDAVNNESSVKKDDASTSNPAPEKMIIVPAVTMNLL
jgi:outer membrane protein